MIVAIKRVDESLPMPEYQTSGAAAFDLYARTDFEIQPGEIARIPSNLIVDTPETHYLQITLRSGAPKKKLGLVVPQGVGIIDSDYNGSEDEILIQVLNTGKDVIKIERGERFAQAVFVRIDKAEFKEAEEMASQNRRGFGSTG